MYECRSRKAIVFIITALFKRQGGEGERKERRSRKYFTVIPKLF